MAVGQERVFDESTLTPEVAEAIRRLSTLLPGMLAPVKGARVNPALEPYGLDGQMADDGVMEINPVSAKRMAMPDLMALVGHEASHAGGADESTAQRKEDELRKGILMLLMSQAALRR